MKMELTVPTDITREEAQLFLAIKLYELERISLEKAAEISGMRLRDFMITLGKQKIPVINYDPEDLDEEVEALKKRRDSHESHSHS